MFTLWHTLCHTKLSQTDSMQQPQKAMCNILSATTSCSTVTSGSCGFTHCFWKIFGRIFVKWIHFSALVPCLFYSKILWTKVGYGWIRRLIIGVIHHPTFVIRLNESEYFFSLWLQGNSSEETRKNRSAGLRRKGHYVGE